MIGFRRITRDRYGRFSSAARLITELAAVVFCKRCRKCEARIPKPVRPETLYDALLG